MMEETSSARRLIGALVCLGGEAGINQDAINGLKPSIFP